MADRDRWTTWQAEQAGTNHGPTIGQALGLFAAIALVLLALAWSPLATAGGGRSMATPSATETTPPPCATHWPPTCDRRR
jgi:hypothetical protein